MKNSLKIILNKATGLFVGLVALGIIYGCVEDELPGPGSMPDDTPPAASFSYASQENFLEVKFTNLSTEALSYLWDFGVNVEVPDSVLTAIDPSYTYDKVGTYNVTLTATDGLGIVSDTTVAVVVEEGPYLPVILEAEFEGDGETGDARDPWDAEWSTVIQITSDGALDADGNKTKGGKLPSDGKRVAYQEMVVEAESNYDIAFVYTLTDAVAGKLTVEILDVTANGETFQTYEDTRDHVIGAVTLNDQDDPDTYVGGEVSFASGTSTKIAIMVSNSVGIEARFDNFTVEIGNAGAVPPSANFTIAQSESNYLEYTFTNASLNAATYSWDFGDDSAPSTEESPVHEYEEAGTYTVTLSVKSEGGLTGELSEEFTIHAPVTSEFTHLVDDVNYKKYNFTDASTGAVSLMWDFGDGYTATLANPSHTYEEDGIYTVTLTSTSLTGFTDESSVDITVALGFVASIENGGFEDYQESDGENKNDNRIAWRNMTLETDADVAIGDSDYMLQITTSVNSGNYAGKLPTAENSSKPRRWLYQAITVEANTDYTITGYIRNKAAGVGSTVTFQIYDAPFDDAATIDDVDAILAEEDFDNSTGHDVSSYTAATISFNSGSSTEVVLFISNDYTLTAVDSESFVDDFSIAKD